MSAESHSQELQGRHEAPGARNYNRFMRPRFLAPDLASGGEVIALPQEEVRHLTRVLRLGEGDTITVFDGRGNEFLARVEDVARDQVAVRPLTRTQPAEEPSVTLTLAQALLKGNKLDEVVRDATMLGVAAIQPLLTLRASVRASALRDGHALERWQRIAVSSTKQCRRAVVPEVRPALEFERFLDRDGSALRVLLVEPNPWSEDTGHIGVLRTHAKPQSATVAIGPEGGWTEEEISQATAHGFVPLTLGGRTLRADAVPVAAVAVLQFLWGDL